MSFQNKTVIITGGAKGIGEGCVRVFHREGANVALFDVDEEAGRHLESELKNNIRFISCNVADESEVKNAVTQVVNRFGGVDVLVNNAGILRYASVTETTEQDWNQIMDVNLKGAFLCAKHTIPHMQKKGSGAVINISSAQAFVTQQNVAAYATSKSALIGLTHSIAVDYAPEIRCVAVCPGGVDTPLNRKAFQQSANPERARQETIDIHLVKRMAKAEEIGECVAYVASEKGSFFTGQPLRIDGGVGLQIAGSKND